MYHVKLLDLESLSKQELAAYQTLTEPRYFLALQNQNPDHINDTSVIAIGAELDENPAALLLATTFKHLKFAEVHSLYVDSLHRRKGLGQEMLKMLENQARHDAASSISYIYKANVPEVRFLERILQKLSWTPPRHFAIEAKFDQKAFHPPGFEEFKKIPQGFAIFPWKDLKEKERKDLLFRLDQRSIPYYISPFFREAIIEETNSIGLKQGDKIVGWMVTHRMEKDTVQYTSLYVDPSVRSFPFAHLLLFEAISRQQKGNIPFATLYANISQVDAHWLAFIEQHVLPYALESSYYKQSWKHL